MDDSGSLENINNTILNAVIQINVSLISVLCLKLPEMRQPLLDLLRSPPPSQQKNDIYYLQIIKIFRDAVEYFEESDQAPGPEWFRGLLSGGKD